MEQRQTTPDAPQEPLAPHSGGDRTPRRRRPRQWLGWATGAAMMVAVGLTTPQPAAACAWYDPLCLADALLDPIFDKVKGVFQLTWNVITLDFDEAFEDLKEVGYNQICGPGLSVFTLAVANGLEADFDECINPSRAITQTVLDRLALYIKSPLDTVHIHTGCNLNADVIPGDDSSYRDAITFGEHIYVKSATFDPENNTDDFATLAHELTHVLQYRQKGFADFTCQYATHCAFGLHKGCEIEQSAYDYDALVRDDYAKDKDGVFPPADNCPDRFNPGQEDADGDGLGDACERVSTAKVVQGDFNGDGKMDLALTGPSDWSFIPVALSSGNGLFQVTYDNDDTDFVGWAGVRGTRVITGDFNRDGRTDLALLPGPETPWWYTIPVAFAKGDGTFRITNAPAADFAAWAQVPGVHVSSGDFNRDGRTDLALLPGPETPWWYTIPVAFANGDGTFRITNTPAADFAAWAQVPGVHVSSGDFNRDGRTDLALLPGPGTPWWYTIPVAFANGDGTFRITNTPAGEFAAWAQVPGVHVSSGDFNRDGRTDLALLPGPGTPWWYTIPVAFANGDGTFRITNTPAGEFAAWAQVPGVHVSSGDFNRDGRTDLALLPGPETPWWYTIPVAFANGDGTFRITNTPAGEFAAWAQVPGVRVSSGDFNGDGRTDLALLPGPETPWWYTIPVAFANGDGTFRITNAPAAEFAAWAQWSEFALP